MILYGAFNVIHYTTYLQVNSLNSKNRALKRDKDEVEGELESSKSRIRQLRSELEEAEDNASTLQTTITKLRSAHRKKVCLMLFDIDHLPISGLVTICQPTMYIQSVIRTPLLKTPI